MELEYTVQNYDWGKKGLNSIVARLLKEAYPETDIIDDKCYAELWMGTHPNGPSRIKSNNKPLLGLIKEHPEYTGDVRIGSDDDLSYLFKVLSVEKALSIQVHPSKDLAKKLHDDQPHIYKDPNHKPELAIALTPFQALCGFRPMAEIKKFLQEIPELRAVIGKEKVATLLNCNDECYMEQLKECFYSLMTCNNEVVGKSIQELLNRLKESEGQSCTYMYDLLKKLNSQFPNDIGCFCIYFFNLIQLKPFEAIFLDANEPHCYISGDCIECMACSDNVVRAGLTPKYKDVKTLCDMLNYHGDLAENKKFSPSIEDEYVRVFRPPVPDFAVALIQLPSKLGNYKLRTRTSGSILLVVEGLGSIKEGGNLRSGVALFLPSNEEITIVVKEDLLLFQAFANNN